MFPVSTWIIGDSPRVDILSPASTCRLYIELRPAGMLVVTNCSRSFKKLRKALEDRNVANVRLAVRVKARASKDILIVDDVGFNGYHFASMDEVMRSTSCSTSDFQAAAVL